MPMTISLSPSGNLLVEIPRRRADAPTHSVEIPPTEEGAQALVRILRAQTRVQREDLSPGTTASPLQSQVDAWLRAGNKIKQGGLGRGLLRKCGLDADLADLVLDDADLEL